MPMKLATTLKHLQSLTNIVNKTILLGFHEYLKEVDTSQNYQNQMLKELISYAEFLNSTSFYDVHRKEQITMFLDTKAKSIETDPDKKWITTYNDYLWRIKYLFRWLHNYNLVKEKGDEPLTVLDWKTPSFAAIKKKKTKRLSPYLESELWEKNEYLSIIKYETQIRNRAALTLLWDFNARNHEVTSLKLKHIRLKERYGEGEVPSESKTGSGPILLTSSFPYVRDLLNVHPYRNQPEARLIYNLNNGGPITADHLCTIFKQLRNHIVEQIESGKISDAKEVEQLQLFLRTKKWNPYCLRHSSLTSDSDYLPEFALKKKARWSMNSRQGARYIKARMGNEMKNKILMQNGIITEDQARPIPSVRNCPRCEYVNTFHNQYCDSCSYPLTSEAYDNIKLDEDRKLREAEQRMQLQHEELKKQNDLKIDEIKQFFTDKFNLLFETYGKNQLEELRGQGVSAIDVVKAIDYEGDLVIPDQNKSARFKLANERIELDEKPIEPYDQSSTYQQILKQEYLGSKRSIKECFVQAHNSLFIRLSVNNRRQDSKFYWGTQKSHACRGNWLNKYHIVLGIGPHCSNSLECLGQKNLCFFP
jgi:integrase/recombinase XerD